MDTKVLVVLISRPRAVASKGGAPSTKATVKEKCGNLAVGRRGVSQEKFGQGLTPRGPAAGSGLARPEEQTGGGQGLAVPRGG
jgi:hypothetical protein